MALDEFLSLVDAKLADKFEAKAFDPQKHRDALIKRLDTAKSQFLATEPARGRKMFSVNNGVVKLTLPVEIQGQSEFHIASESFPDALDTLKKNVNAGALDKQLEFYANGTGSEVAEIAPRKKRAPMSEEAKAAMVARRLDTMKKNGTTPGKRKS